MKKIAIGLNLSPVLCAVGWITLTIAALIAATGCHAPAIAGAGSVYIAQQPTQPKLTQATTNAPSVSVNTPGNSFARQIPCVVTVSTGGSTAQAAGDGAAFEAKTSTTTKLASYWWVWLTVGIVGTIAAWVGYRLIFTGARISLTGLLP